MRFKELTINKLEASSNLLNTLSKSIESGTINKNDALRLIDTINRNMEFLIERLSLESQD
jgi:hypothetical protein